MTYPDLWDYLRHEAFDCEDGYPEPELVDDERIRDPQCSEALRRRIRETIERSAS